MVNVTHTLDVAKIIKNLIYFLQTIAATDHFNLKKTETCFRACLKSIFYVVN